MAEIDGEPVGIIQIIDPAEEEFHYWGDVAPNLRAINIWIGEERLLGKGLGTTMMQLALARCFAAPEVTAVLIDPLASNVRARRFYEAATTGKTERLLGDPPAGLADPSEGSIEIIGVQDDQRTTRRCFCFPAGSTFRT